MKIVISAQGDLTELPADIPPQNVINLQLMPGSNVFLSGFDDNEKLAFKHRLVGNANVVIELPLMIDWENKQQLLANEIGALTKENIKLRQQLLASPLGIIRPGDDGFSRIK